MTLAIFPSTPLSGWSVKKTPSWPATIQTGATGKESRVQMQTRPRWRWELTYEILRDKFDVRQSLGLGVGYNELRTIAGFYLFVGGPLTAFLYDDPTDDAVTAGFIGTGDAVTTQFQLVRAFSGYNEPINSINSLSHIYLNGALQPGGNYSVSATGLVTFVAAPPNLSVITADFTYYFQVRFEENSIEFENFMFQLWTAKSVKFIQVF